MPAAAVIPAPIAYIKVAAVKKLVVGSQAVGGWCGRTSHRPPALLARPADSLGAIHLVSWVADAVTLKKLECSKQATHACTIMHGITKQDLGSVCW